MSKGTKLTTKKKIFNKPLNEFFKKNEPENWSLLNFLNYRYMIQTNPLFTHNEKNENGYYSSFIDIYRLIDVNEANRLRTNFLANKNFFFGLIFNTL